MLILNKLSKYIINPNKCITRYKDHYNKDYAGYDAYKRINTLLYGFCVNESQYNTFWQEFHKSNVYCIRIMLCHESYILELWINNERYMTLDPSSMYHDIYYVYSCDPFYNGDRYDARHIKRGLHYILGDVHDYFTNKYL